MAIEPDAKKWLADVFSHNVKFNEPMSGHTSLRVGGPAEVYVAPESKEELVMLINRSLEKEIPYMVLGGGTNLLVKDGGIAGLVIALTKCLQGISQTGTGDDTVFITAMAGSKMQALCGFAIDKGFEGMNFALGIPGTVGGGIKMNAGTSLGRVENHLDNITALLPPGKIKRIKRENLKFDYRKLMFEDKEEEKIRQEQIIILDGCFCLHPSCSEKLRKEAEEILKERKRKQPVNLPSAGCFFKNPISGKTTGELIELAGRKGKRIGGAEMSTKHANFIINSGNASAADFLALIQIVTETVFRTFGINLETEVKIVGT